jgi:hypothetical protein
MASPLSPKLDWPLANPIWAQALNPIVSNAMLSGLPSLNVLLINGVTVINHKLGRLMQGWFLTDIDGAALIYRSADFNKKTLTLTSNAQVKVNLWLF